jgi:predicted transcriptional regulator
MEAVRAALVPLSLKQIHALAHASGVPWSTIYKIQLGTTPNPGIETVRRFLPHVRTIAKASKPAKTA